MIEVVNQQRYRRIDREYWVRFAQKALNLVSRDRKGLTIAFVSNQRMRSLNKSFRGLNKTTDVLSFPTEGDAFREPDDNLGDVAISVEQAENQALANGMEFEQEIAQLILHGLLHLCGYDHETDNGEMNRLEIRLRKKLGI